MGEIKDMGEEFQWHLRRQRGIGSSESPVLALGKLFDTMPLDIYVKKKQDPQVNSNENPNFRRGHTYEPLAIELFSRQYGIEVYSPRTDNERYNDYQVFHGEHHVFSDFDGLCEDAWVMEAKCPRQMVFDQIVNEGLKDYYQIQSHHLAGVANDADSLPVVGDKFKGKIKGTRVVVYAPEEIKILVVEIPYDSKRSGDIFTICDKFWNNHVHLDVPPTAPMTKMVMPQVGGEYEMVKGNTWVDVARAYSKAKAEFERAKDEKKRLEGEIQAAMRASGKYKVMLDSGSKFSWTEQKGKETLNTAALVAAHPKVRIEDYKSRGKPSRVFRSYLKED